MSVSDMPDAGGDRRCGAARRTARRNRGIARVLGVAVHQIGGEPAKRKCRRVGAAENHGASLAQIVHHRIVAARDHVALQFDAVGGGKTRLVDIDLDGNRHAGKRAQVFLAGDRRIDGVGLRQHILRTMVDHGVDRRVHGIETPERR
jgi:hypothetical protein